VPTVDLGFGRILHFCSIAMAGAIPINISLPWVYPIFLKTVLRIEDKLLTYSSSALSA